MPPVSSKATSLATILGIPKTISFSNSPVRYTSAQTKLIQNNTGQYVSYEFFTNQPFTVNPPSVELEPGKQCQIDICFSPDFCGSYSEQLYVSINGKRENDSVTLSGSAENMNLELLSKEVVIPQAFVGKQSSGAVQLRNHSEIRVQYQWVLDPSAPFSFSPSEGEVWPGATDGFTIQFSPPSAKMWECTATCVITGRETKDALKVKLYGEGIGALVESSYDTIDAGEILLKTQYDYKFMFKNRGGIDAHFTLIPSSSVSLEVAQLERESFSVNRDTTRQKSTTEGNGERPSPILPLTRAPLTFDPPNGMIPEGTDLPIKVSYFGEKVGPFEECGVFAFEDTDLKLKCTVRGVVLFPTIEFNKSGIEFGSCSMGFLVHRDVELFNSSEIPLHYKTRFEVHEDDVSWKQNDGATNAIEDQKSGQQSAAVTDRQAKKKKKGHTFLSREFSCTPQQGTLEPQTRIRMRIDFIPAYIRRYSAESTRLCVDVTEIGENALVLPLSADAMVPRITVSTTLIELGDIFFRTEYHPTFDFINTTSLFAQYEMVPEEEALRSIASITAQVTKGPLAPQSHTRVVLNFMADRLGPIEIPFFFRIVGNDQPIKFTITANALGPRLTFSRQSVSFGDIPVITDVIENLTMTNEAEIPADFRMYCKRKDGVFKPEVSEGTIPAHESFILPIHCYLKDAILFKDVLNIIVTDAPQDYAIPLSANGKGDTLVATEALDGEALSSGKDMNSFDFGPRFINQPIAMEFMLCNRGRQPQAVQWNSLKKTKSELAALPESEQNRPPLFSIVPARLTLKPGEEALFTVSGQSEKVESVMEKWVCKVTQGKQSHNLFEPIIKADFQLPLIIPNKKQFLFVFHSTDENNTLATDRESFQGDRPDSANNPSSTDPEMSLGLLKDTLTLTNNTSLPVHASLITSAPFHLSDDVVCVDPHSTKNVEVTFNGKFNEDEMQSRTFKDKIQIVYRDREPSRNKDTIELIGEVHYPNLQTKTKIVDFGCVLTDAKKTIKTTFTNSSTLPVSASWVLVEKALSSTPASTLPRISQSANQTHSSTSNANTINSNVRMSNSNTQNQNRLSQLGSMQPLTEALADLINITPNQFDLEPGQTIEVSFTMIGKLGIQLSSTHSTILAVCDVVGGPSYEVQLKGSASTIAYHIDTTRFDFGAVPIGQDATMEAMIVNDGAVPLDFTIPPIRWPETNPSFFPKPSITQNVFSVSPQSGRVNGNGKQKLVFKYCPVVPEVSFACVDLAIESFRTEVFTIFGRGIFPRLTIGLTRVMDNIQQDLLDNAVTSVVDEINNSPAVEPSPAILMQLNPQSPDGKLPSELCLLKNGLESIPPELLNPIMYPEEFVSDGAASIQRIKPKRRQEPAVDIQTQTTVATAWHFVSPPQATLRNSLAAAIKSLNEVQSQTAPPTPGAQKSGLGETLAYNPAVNNLPKNLAPVITQLEAESERIGMIKQLVPHSTLTQTLIPLDPKVTTRIPKNVPVLARYVCEFGSLITSQTKKRTFRIVNTGFTPLTLDMDLRPIIQQGFNVTPDKIQKLPPNEHVDMTISFTPHHSALIDGKGTVVPTATASPTPATSPPSTSIEGDRTPKGLKLSGTINTTLPITIRGGPIVLISLQASISVPDVELSSDRLDFGSLRVGQQAIGYFRITNACPATAGSPIPASWSLRTNPDNQDHSSWLAVEPLKGTLQAGEHTDVKVIFTPQRWSMLPVGLSSITQNGKYVNYSLKIPIKISANTQTKFITIRGQSAEADILITPQNISLPPILPFTNGIQYQFSIKNFSPFPVEVFSTEFDRQYMFEESVIRECVPFEEKKKSARQTQREAPPQPSLVPSRSAGEPLPSELIKAFKEKHVVDWLMTDGNVPDDYSLKMFLESQQPKARDLPQPTPKPEEIQETPVDPKAAAKAGQKPVAGTAAPTRAASTQQLPPAEHPKDTQPAGDKGVGDSDFTDKSAPAQLQAPSFVPAYVVTGLPMSGKTTSASLLGEEFELPVWQTTGIVNSIILQSESISKSISEPPEIPDLETLREQEKEKEKEVKGAKKDVKPSSSEESREFDPMMGLKNRELLSEEQLAVVAEREKYAADLELIKLGALAKETLQKMDKDLMAAFLDREEKKKKRIAEMNEALEKIAQEKKSKRQAQKKAAEIAFLKEQMEPPEPLDKAGKNAPKAQAKQAAQPKPAAGKGKVVEEVPVEPEIVDPEAVMKAKEKEDEAHFAFQIESIHFPEELLIQVFKVWIAGEEQKKGFVLDDLTHSIDISTINDLFLPWNQPQDDDEEMDDENNRPLTKKSLNLRRLFPTLETLSETAFTVSRSIIFAPFLFDSTLLSLRNSLQPTHRLHVLLLDTPFAATRGRYLDSLESVKNRLIATPPSLNLLLNGRTLNTKLSDEQYEDLTDEQRKVYDESVAEYEEERGLFEKDLEHINDLIAKAKEDLNNAVEVLKGQRQLPPHAVLINGVPEPIQPPAQDQTQAAKGAAAQKPKPVAKQPQAKVPVKTEQKDPVEEEQSVTLPVDESGFAHLSALQQVLLPLHPSQNPFTAIAQLYQVSLRAAILRLDVATRAYLVKLLAENANAQQAALLAEQQAAKDAAKGAKAPAPPAAAQKGKTQLPPQPEPEELSGSEVGNMAQEFAQTATFDGCDGFRGWRDREIESTLSALKEKEHPPTPAVEAKKPDPKAKDVPVQQEEISLVDPMQKVMNDNQKYGVFAKLPPCVAHTIRFWTTRRKIDEKKYNLVDETDREESEPEPEATEAPQPAEGYVSNIKPSDPKKKDTAPTVAAKDQPAEVIPEKPKPVIPDVVFADEEPDSVTKEDIQREIEEEGFDSSIDMDEANKITADLGNEEPNIQQEADSPSTPKDDEALQPESSQSHDPTPGLVPIQFVQHARPSFVDRFGCTQAHVHPYLRTAIPDTLLLRVIKGTVVAKFHSFATSQPPTHREDPLVVPLLGDLPNSLVEKYRQKEEAIENAHRLAYEQAELAKGPPIPQVSVFQMYNQPPLRQGQTGTWSSSILPIPPLEEPPPPPTEEELAALDPKKKAAAQKPQPKVAAKAGAKQPEPEPEPEPPAKEPEPKIPLIERLTPSEMALLYPSPLPPLTSPLPQMSMIQFLPQSPSQQNRVVSPKINRKRPDNEPSPSIHNLLLFTIPDSTSTLEPSLTSHSYLKQLRNEGKDKMRTSTTGNRQSVAKTQAKQKTTSKTPSTTATVKPKATRPASPSRTTAKPGSPSTTQKPASPSRTASPKAASPRATPPSTPTKRPSSPGRAASPSSKDEPGAVKSKSRPSSPTQTPLSPKPIVEEPEQKKVDGKIIPFGLDTENLKPQTRWVIDANSEISVFVSFRSDILGKLDTVLHFETTETAIIQTTVRKGGKMVSVSLPPEQGLSPSSRLQYLVKLRASVALPSIINDPKMIFRNILALPKKEKVEADPWKWKDNQPKEKEEEAKYPLVTPEQLTCTHKQFLILQPPKPKKDSVKKEDAPEEEKKEEDPSKNLEQILNTNHFEFGPILVTPPKILFGDKYSQAPPVQPKGQAAQPKAASTAPSAAPTSRPTTPETTRLSIPTPAMGAYMHPLTLTNSSSMDANVKLSFLRSSSTEKSADFIAPPLLSSIATQSNLQQLQNQIAQPQKGAPKQAEKAPAKPPVAAGKTEEVPPEEPKKEEKFVACTKPCESNLPSFFLQSDSITIPPNESKTIDLYSIPPSIGNSPVPLFFPLSAVGDIPKISVSAESLTFEKLLVKRTLEKSFVLKNVSTLPTKWKLLYGGPGQSQAAPVKGQAKAPVADQKADWNKDGTALLPPSFSVSPKEGLLAPGTSVTVKVKFSPLEPTNVNETLKIHISDENDLVSSATEQATPQAAPAKGAAPVADPLALKSHTVGITAEAFEVAVDTTFQPVAEGLHFGTLRVEEKACHSIFLQNKGKYDSTYEVVMSENAKQCVTISPMSGVLKAAGDAPAAKAKPNPKDAAKPEGDQLTVDWIAHKEVNIDSTEDIQIRIYEKVIELDKPDEEEKTLTVRSSMTAKKQATKQKERQAELDKALSCVIPVPLKGSAVFSSFRLQPSHGLNFGPLAALEKRTKVFELHNTGLFEMRWMVSKEQDAKDNLSKLNSLITAANAEPANPKDKKPAPAAANQKASSDGSQETLQVGPFTIHPAAGTIPTGESTVVTVDFVWDSAQVFNEALRVLIAGSNPEDGQNGMGMQFELSAECCMPGLDVNNVQSIFEEQSIVPKADSSTTEGGFHNTNVYALDERSFYYGPLIVGKTSSQRFKLTNPNKIPCDVSMFVVSKQIGVEPAQTQAKPQAGKPAPAAAQSSQQESTYLETGFEVEPKRTTIPPHGTQIVTCTFIPTEMRHYQATFKAIVDPHFPPPQAETKAPAAAKPAPGAPAPAKSDHEALLEKIKSLVFDLDGQGALTHVIITNPAPLMPSVSAVEDKKAAPAKGAPAASSQNDDIGKSVLTFKRTIVGKSASAFFTVKNDSMVQCNARLELPSSQDFQALLSDSDLLTDHTVTDDHVSQTLKSASPKKKGRIISFSLSPQQTANVDVIYRPTSAEAHSDKIRVTADGNAFDEAILILRGEAFESSITFDSLPSVSSQLFKQITVQSAPNAAPVSTTPLQNAVECSAKVSVQMKHRREKQRLEQDKAAQPQTQPKTAAKAPAAKPPAQAGKPGDSTAVDKEAADLIASFGIGADAKEVVNNSTDILSFGDVLLGEARKVTFVMNNQGETPLRFCWNPVGTPETQTGLFASFAQEKQMKEMKKKVDDERKALRAKLDAEKAEQEASGKPDPKAKAQASKAVQQAQPEDLIPDPEPVWPTPDDYVGCLSDFTISPSVGHIQPNSKKLITATFTPSAVQNTAFPLMCRLVPIKYRSTAYVNGEVPDWDDTRRTAVWVREEGGVDRTSVTTPTPSGGEDQSDMLSQTVVSQTTFASRRQTKMKKVIEIHEEPPYDEIEVEEAPHAVEPAANPKQPAANPKQPAAKPGQAAQAPTALSRGPRSTLKPIFLLVQGVSDYAQYKIDTVSPVKFRDTLMFTKRVFELPIENIGTVAFTMKPFVHLPLSAYQKQVWEENRAKGGTSITNPYDADLGTLATASRFAILNEESDQSAPPTSPQANEDQATAFKNTLIPPPGPIDEDPLAPFSVSPSEVTLEPGDKKTVTVTFCPQDTIDCDERGKPRYTTGSGFERELWFNVPHRSPSLPAPVVVVKGNAQRPLCHFELAESDYIDSRRTDDLNASYPMNIEGQPSTKVLEFSSKGIGIKSTTTFFVINPSSLQWDFEWECTNPLITSQVIESPADPNKAALQSKVEVQCPFKCKTRKGSVQPGMKAEIAFDYIPQSLDLVESVWQFKISSLSLAATGSTRSQQFLLVGQSEEPMVYLQPHHVHFQSRLLNKAVEMSTSIVNAEDIPFSFKFDLSSIHEAMLGYAETGSRSSGGKGSPKDSRSILSVQPSSGTIPARSQTPIKLTFFPRDEKDYNFNIPCTVDKKSTKLNLNVKGEGYSIKQILTFLTSTSTGDEEGTGTGVTVLPSGVAATIKTPVKPVIKKDSSQPQKSARAPPKTPRSSAPGASPSKPEAQLPQTPSSKYRGITQYPADESDPMLIDFGNVQIKEGKVKVFELKNDGKYPIDYNWQLIRSTLVTQAPNETEEFHSGSAVGRGKVQKEQEIWAIASTAFQITPMFGCVAKGETQRFQISFKPKETIKINSIRCIMKIVNGPSYYFTLAASAYRPNLSFEWMKYSFGPSYIFSSIEKARDSSSAKKTQPVFGVTPKPLSTSLKLTNKENYEISYEPLFMTQSDDGALESDASPLLLPPGQSRLIHFYFHPHEVKQYEWKLPFEVNGLFTVTVTLTGEGIPLKLDVPQEHCPELTILTPASAVAAGPPVDNVPNLAALSPLLSQLLSKQPKAPVDPEQTPRASTQPKETVPAKKPTATQPKQAASQPEAKPSVSDESSSRASSIQSAITALESGRRISFDALRIGQSCSRQFRVVNKSKNILKFNISGCLSALRDLYISLQSNTQTEVTLEPQQHVDFKFTFTPKTRVREFSVPIVAETIGVGQSAKGAEKGAGAGTLLSIPLVSFTGCCLGLEVKLDTPNLSFGPVVRGSRLTRTITLQNGGDLGCSFSWETKLPPEFSIDPVRGVLKAGADQEISVTFEPPLSKENEPLEIKKDQVYCVITGEKSGSTGTAQQLRLLTAFSGTSINQQTDSESVDFSCPVRQVMTKEIQLSLPPSVQANRKASEALTLPVSISGDYFSGPSTVSVDSAGKMTINVTYKPMTMTIAGAASPLTAGYATTPPTNTTISRQNGSLFVPLPDGSGIMRELVGHATDPEPTETLEWKIGCHQQKIFSLKVANWMKTTGHFSIGAVTESSVTFTKVEPTPENAPPAKTAAPKQESVTVPLHVPGIGATGTSLGVKVETSPSIDIAGGQERVCRIGVKAIKEGTCEFILRFAQEGKEKTKPVEYAWFKIKLVSENVVTSQPIVLSTSVRRPFSNTITLSNPVDVVASFTSNCANNAVNVPDIITVGPLSTKEVEIVFVPLEVIDSIVPLTFSSSEAGNFTYPLHLIALPPPPDKKMTFKTSLGASQDMNFRFTNRYADGPVEFKCFITCDGIEKKEDSPFVLALPNGAQSIQAPPAVSATAGVEVTVPVRFEPTSIGMFKATLSAASDKAGTFSCILLGTSINPTPQGPYTVKANTNGYSITVKNVFNTQTTFGFSVDNPAFTVKQSESIPPKKSAVINVQYKPLLNAAPTGAHVSGRLTITCPLVSSGKSAIAVALSVVFGVRASTTTRGTQIQSLIQEGKRFAEIEVSLGNVGLNAYKHSIFGDVITIVRRLTKGGHSSYRILSENRELTSQSKKELDQILFHFGIQADSPCQIMHQEEMKAFLAANATPHDLYKFFMRSTLLQQIQETLINVRMNLDFTMKAIETNKNTLLPDLKEKIKVAQNDLKASQNYTQRVKECDECKHRILWWHVQNLRRKISDEEARMRTLQQNQRNYEMSREDMLSRLTSNLIESVEHFKTELALLEIIDQEKREDFQQNSRTIKENQKKINEAQGRINKCDKEIKIAKDSIDSRQKLLKRMDASLAASKANAAKRSQDQELVQLRQRLKKLVQEHESLEKIVNAESQTEFTEFDDQINRLRLSIEECQRTLNEKARGIAELRRQIKPVPTVVHNRGKNDETDRLRQYDREMPNLVTEIGRRYPQFRDKPIGPLGMHIKVLNPKWAPVIETHLRGALRAFVFTSMKDEQTFSDIRKQGFERIHTLSFVVRRTTPYGIDPSKTVLPRPPQFARNGDNTIPSILSQIECTSHVVLNLLIDQYHIENVMLTETREEADLVLFSSKNADKVRHKTFRTLDGYRLRKAGSVAATFDEDVQFYGLISVNSDESKLLKEQTKQEHEMQLQRNNDLRKDVEKEQEEIRRLNDIQDGQQRSLSEIMNKKNKTEQRMSLQQDKLKQLAREIRDLNERQVRLQNATLQAANEVVHTTKEMEQRQQLETEIQENEKIIEDKQAEKLAIKENEIEPILTLMEELRAKETVLDASRKEHSKLMSGVRSQKNECDREMNHILKKLNDFNKHKMNVTNDLATANKNLTHMESQLEEMAQKATIFSKEPELIKETKQELERLLKEREAAVEFSSKRKIPLSFLTNTITQPIPETASYPYTLTVIGRPTEQDEKDSYVILPVLSLEEAEIQLNHAETNLEMTERTIERLQRNATLIEEARANRQEGLIECRDRMFSLFKDLFRNELTNRGMNGYVTVNTEEETLSLKFESQASQHQLTLQDPLFTINQPQHIEPEPSNDLFLHPQISQPNPLPEDDSNKLREEGMLVDEAAPYQAPSRYARSLSGGERSFSTICFLLALWGLSSHPFRLIDEFDVFCDELTRKISADLLIRHSISHNSQLILITPLDRGAFFGYTFAKSTKKTIPRKQKSRSASQRHNQEDSEDEITLDAMRIIVLKKTSTFGPTAADPVE
ncbi:putative hydrocephalus-inducing like protein [Blattamonas nauphoetae]|uniref:Hydrocephalus-inducing like protein n=1 Tax=Blattamonas nauphoetae TaxID=2049346 RepID=A0ABQ9Y503_9EUKA|nr:putative hydrocephalus-inducing like protein [Blattamonas nauphoetae]